MVELVDVMAVPSPPYLVLFIYLFIFFLFFATLTAPVTTWLLLLWGLGEGALSGVWPVYTFGVDRSGFTMLDIKCAG